MLNVILLNVVKMSAMAPSKLCLPWLSSVERREKGSICFKNVALPKVLYFIYLVKVAKSQVI